jgi:hypothetical protein
MQIWSPSFSAIVVIYLYKLWRWLRGSRIAERRLQRAVSRRGKMALRGGRKAFGSPSRAAT